MKKNVINQEFNLKEPEEMSLIELNPNSIFMKVNRFVLGKYSPDPMAMKNYCPYFWLTVCSFILLIPVTTLKLIWLPFKGIGWLFENVLIGSLEKSFIIDFNANQIKRARILYSNNPRNDSSVKTRASLPWYIDRGRFFNIYDSWVEDEFKSAGKSERQLLEELQKLYAELAAMEQKRKESETKMSWNMPEFKGLDKFKDSIEKKFDDFKESTKDKVLAQKKLVLFTQRFLGLFVTLFLGAALYFVAVFTSKGFIWLCNIWNWTVIWNVTWHGLIYIGVAVGIIGAIFGIVQLLLWLVNLMPSNNLLFRFLKNFIVRPLYFLFVIFLWKIICVAFIWEILTKIVLWMPILFLFRGIVGTGALFKSYFGQEYSALCPGIKWVSKGSSN